MADTNLRVWSALETTSPSATKGFQRAGGFKGTAIKPIYTSLKMTETFGPCGVGWGVSAPTYELVKGDDGSVAVYCTVTLWFRDPETGQRSEPIPGVGGDFAIAKRSSGLFADDEAFKKAFTDAIGNAQKLIGMSADVHMGLFDDHKYVSDRRREEAEDKGGGEERGPAPGRRFQQSHERRDGAPPASDPPPPQDAPKGAPLAGTFDWQVPTRPMQIDPTWMGTPPNKTIDWAEWGGKLKHVLNLCTDEREVAEWVKLNRGPLKGLEGEKPKWYAALMADVTKRESDLRAGVAGTRAAAA